MMLSQQHVLVCQAHFCAWEKLGKPCTVWLVAIQYFTERLVHGPYQSAWLASPDDCQIFTTRLARRVGWHPNRLPEPQKQVSCVNLDVLRLVFVGTLNYPQRRGSLFFTQSGSSLVTWQSFNWQMNIVGRHADERLKQLIGKCHGRQLEVGEAGREARHAQDA